MQVTLEQTPSAPQHCLKAVVELCNIRHLQAVRLQLKCLFAELFEMGLPPTKAYMLKQDGKLFHWVY